MNDKVVELNREYWGPVHDMCAGTNVKPWECVRFRHPKMNKPLGFHGHPIFDQFSDEHTFEFAVTVLEDRPVWIGDTIYHKDSPNLIGVVVTDHDSMSLKLKDGWWCLKGNLSKYFTWTPQPSKRTFTLNEVELPCPVSDSNGVKQSPLFVFGEKFYFESYDDAELFERKLTELLTEARDKP